jgi:D-xylose transport system ATP-binding protein
MRNIHKAFGGVRAVDDVSLDLYRGEVVGLLGHNGAGKSTLISILAGADTPDSGSMSVDGQTFTKLDPKTAKAQGIETIYQNLALAGNLDAVTNLFLGREIRRFGLFRAKKAMREAAAAVLARINPRFTNIDDETRNLSGGQRQSIAIARAIYFNAKVIIMDEPTAALGPAESRLVKELILRLKAEGVGVLLITHDIHEVFDLADRLVVMADGRVVGQLNTHEATKDEVLAMIILGGKGTRQDAKDAAAAIPALAETGGSN